MGSCIGRCFCEVGKCFCCDCLVFGSNLRDSITRRRAKNINPQTFVLRRQSSSTTIEFENLMFDFDLPDSSTSLMQMRPKSHSNWLSLKDDYKQSELKVQEFNTFNDFTNPLSKSFIEIDSDITSINQFLDRTRELPIIDSLISKTTFMSTKTESPDLKLDKISLGGASSMGELQWENEITGDGVEQNGNELEWDDYEQNNIALNNETEQLILEIEELTQTSNQLP